MKTKFINAQKLAKANPNDFKVPSKEILDSIDVGSFVKVSVVGERFWVLVSKVESCS